MPAPLSNLISAIEAPVASSRHSIFSCMPLSDFSRHGTESVLIRISSSLGILSGNFVMACPTLCLFQAAAEGFFGIELTNAVAKCFIEIAKIVIGMRRSHRERPVAAEQYAAFADRL